MESVFSDRFAILWFVSSKYYSDIIIVLDIIIYVAVDIIFSIIIIIGGSIVMHYHYPYHLTLHIKYFMSPPHHLFIILVWSAVLIQTLHALPGDSSQKAIEMFCSFAIWNEGLVISGWSLPLFKPRIFGWSDSDGLFYLWFYKRDVNNPPNWQLYLC